MLREYDWRKDKLFVIDKSKNRNVWITDRTSNAIQSFEFFGRIDNVLTGDLVR